MRRPLDGIPRERTWPLAHGEGRRVRHCAAVGLSRGCCAGEADEQVSGGAEAQAAEGHLEGGSARAVAEQASAEEVGTDVDGTSASDADREVTDPAEVLHERQRPGLEDLDAASHRATSVN